MWEKRVNTLIMESRRGKDNKPLRTKRMFESVHVRVNLDQRWSERPQVVFMVPFKTVSECYCCVWLCVILLTWNQSVKQLTARTASVCLQYVILCCSHSKSLLPTENTCNCNTHQIMLTHITICVCCLIKNIYFYKFLSNLIKSSVWFVLLMYSGYNSYCLLSNKEHILSFYPIS